MKLFGRKKAGAPAIQTAPRRWEEFLPRLPQGINERLLYDALRRGVPIIDAAIGKLVRLAGGYRVICADERFQAMLDEFCEKVRVGATGKSLASFTDAYLESLLTYGNAAGEIIPSGFGVAGLYNADVNRLEIISGESALERQMYYIEDDGTRRPIAQPEYVLFTALNPPAGEIYGTSVLQGLPALSSILLRIYECIGQNYDRIGNVRYAVTYKPPADGAAYAKERAARIAEEWAAGMNAGRNGDVRDFIAVGDVDIKVIGADNQHIDTSVPVRQLLEQLVAKLSIPPFLLGLSWSTTERMSSQQADILTSELDYYRRLITPVITEICTCFLRMSGCASALRVEWCDVNLQDELSLSQARLNNASAAEIEERIKKMSDS